MMGPINRSANALTPGIDSGFTLVELLVWISALTILMFVLSAPQKNNSDFRKASLTIARVHDIITAATGYRQFTGEWPENGGACIALGAGVDAANDLYSNYNISSVTGWGDPIAVNCNNNNYRVKYNVPDKWESFFINNLEKTELNGDGNSGVDGMVRMRTKVQNDGNLGAKFYYVSDTLTERSDHSFADITDSCGNQGIKNILYSAQAMCFYDLSASDGEVGVGLDSVYDGNKVKFSRLVNITNVDNSGDFPVTTIDFERKRVSEVCDKDDDDDRIDVTVDALVMCNEKN
ncbi:MAG: hypothetical protein COA99_15035 [Moraxellaceae bacterium]|nr:MAG: hypothetical protein COA99_15035 [Moraxellaceae bacterium]